MSTKAKKPAHRGIRTKPETDSCYPKNGVTGVTGVTALNDKEKTGNTDENPGVTGVTGVTEDGVTEEKATDDGATDPLGASIDPADAPPDDDSIEATEPPSPAECPCWRVYLDWWTEKGKKGRRPGVYYHGRVDNADGSATRTDEWVCGPLQIEATTFDRRGESFGRLLRFRDSTNRWHEWNMPMMMLKGDCSDLRGELLNMGLVIDPKHRLKLTHYLMSRAPKRRVLAALSLGWHDGSFVLPDGVIGDGDIRFQSESASPPDFEQRGTLDGWRRDVSARAIGNSVLTLSISAAFAGPLLDLAHIEHAGLHFYGDSSDGKTTVVRGGVSVWGGNALLRTWRATANGLEAAAAESNDSLLALDEIGQAPGREIGAIIYQLANGQGKARANVKGGARRRASWRTVVLSSGERTIESHMQSEGARYHAGQDVRLINLPVSGHKYGVFDVLHDAIDGRVFADSIKSATKRYHGHAGPAFVRWLIAQQDLDVGAAIDEITKAMRPESGQEGRVANQLALIGAAGELATAAEITGWRAGDATKAAIGAFRLWQSERGQGSTEDRQILEAVRSFIERHAEARFSSFEGLSQHGTRDRAGFTETCPVTGEAHYLFLTAGLREAINGHDLKRAISALTAADWLIRKDPTKASSQKKISGSNHRVYIIRLPDDTESEQQHAKEAA